MSTMNPERLAELRDVLDSLDGKMVVHGGLVCELLADRDHHARLARDRLVEFRRRYLEHSASLASLRGRAEKAELQADDEAARLATAIADHSEECAKLRQEIAAARASRDASKTRSRQLLAQRDELAALVGSAIVRASFAPGERGLCSAEHALIASVDGLRARAEQAEANLDHARFAAENYQRRYIIQAGTDAGCSPLPWAEKVEPAAGPAWERQRDDTPSEGDR